jgi:serine/threonine protein kinase
MSNPIFPTTKIIAKKPKRDLTAERISDLRTMLDDAKLHPMMDFNNIDINKASSGVLHKWYANFEEVFEKLNMDLKYIKSGTTGHTFKAISRKDKNKSYAVKVCAFPKGKHGYGNIDDARRPENAELIILRTLACCVINRNTPHFVLPIWHFYTDTSAMMNLPKSIVDVRNDNNDMYRSFIKDYKKDKFGDKVSVLVSEWCKGGDLLDYIRKNYEKMTLTEWKVIIFQVLFTLAKVHEKYPRFRHNDLKINNILVELRDPKDFEGEIYKYKCNSHMYGIPYVGIQTKIWDFDFACIGGVVENNKVNSDWASSLNINNRENKYYDMHYFLSSLSNPRFFKEFYNGGAPDEIVDFVNRIIPLEYSYIKPVIPEKYKRSKEKYSLEQFRQNRKTVSKSGRVLSNIELFTPANVLRTDELFCEFRIPLAR